MNDLVYQSSEAAQWLSLTRRQQQELQMATKKIEGTEQDGSNSQDWTLGKLHQTENLDRKFGSGTHYHRVLIAEAGGSFLTLLLTEGDLSRFRERAATNPEDCLEPSWADKLKA